MNKAEMKRQQAVFLTWEQIQEICSGYVSQVIGREMKIWTNSDEPHLREWGLYLETKSALSKSEGEKLLDAAKADDYDRDVNNFGEYPIRELSSGLGLKMIDQSLGLSTEKSYPDDDGVWLFQNHVPILYMQVEYPEVDCTPDIVAIPLADNKSSAEILDFIEVNIKDIRNNLEDDDRMERFDRLIERMEERLNREISVFSVEKTYSVI